VTPEPHAEDVLRVSNLRTSFVDGSRTYRAVDGVDLSVRAGATLGLVGESGSGKSLTALSIMRLVDAPGRIEPESRILFNGTDLMSLNEDAMRRLRGNELAMVFQEPLTSLNPVMRVGEQIAEAAVIHQGQPWRAAREHAVELLSLVGIAAPRQRARDYPHQLSGGMRQRVMIAIAIACTPRLLLADEPTTALDITIQAQILELLRDLRDRFGMAMVLITHNLGVVAEMASDVAVMYAGKVVERGPVRAVLDHPQHPYTEALTQTQPTVGMDQAEPLRVIPGLVPALHQWPTGCRFAPRCDYAFDRCRVLEPPMFTVGDQQAACWLREPAPVAATSEAAS
jgi:oligopeptide/dipeptide ABC transporter ATP-binding protein